MLTKLKAVQKYFFLKKNPKFPVKMQNYLMISLVKTPPFFGDLLTYMIILAVFKQIQKYG